MMKWLWYLLGLTKGTRHVVIDGSGYSCTDANLDDHIVIAEGEG